jgi:hypothetical protein
MKTSTHPKTDRLPTTLLVSAEVIKELRLDIHPRTGEPLPAASAVRRLKYLRSQLKLDCVRVGNKTYLYTRVGLEKFKRQNFMEAV